MTAPLRSSTKPPSSVFSRRGVVSSQQRYRIASKLGHGGMASVYEALDQQHNRRVAFKRLQRACSPEKQQRNMELFEREFHTLVQLAHPRVVEVYDFGIDTDGAFYTMELLDGGDLQQLAPLPWGSACALARDVCSALSLLHSRRLIHRDLSPRNVRCDAEGRAKLIDFGAVAPMGPNKLLVGTPPCCAPESVYFRPLDARTDLYALGATLYYMLVGQHAYNARQFSSLHEAWQAGFQRPGERGVDLPETLEALVLDLLRVDPDARPANAAEVLQRLAAVDGAGSDDTLQIANAYLSTLSLVGRDAALARVTRRLRRSEAGRGRSVLIEGAPGVGRSRFLDACLLAATLRGAVVARADADDAVDGEYGVVRALARQLLLRMPEAVRECAAPLGEMLAWGVPELASPDGAALPTQASVAPAQRPRLLLALRQWLQQLSRRHPLVIAVDDVHRIDEPSAALFALLATESDQHALCLITSAAREPSEAASGAHKILSAASTTILLECLDAAQTEALLRALFGDVPNMPLLAQHAHALCAGNPRDLLRFAQHLVDRGTARYEAGEFCLPAQFDPGDLPSSLADTLQARVDALSPAALSLACALALCADQRFSFDECAQLGDVADSTALLNSVDALLQADIARSFDDQVGLAPGSWVLPLRARLQAQECALHARLARVFAARGDDQFRAAQHWFHAGEPARGLDVLVAYAVAALQLSEKATTIGDTRMRPSVPGWPETYREALRACAELGRPALDAFILQNRIVGLNALYNIYDTQPMAALFVHLRRDSGLDDWAALDPGLEPASRIARALEITQARYASTPERERVLAPAAAIRYSASFALSALGVIPPSLDVDALDALPDLAPFAPLSPAVQAIQQLHRATRLRMTGQLGPLLAEYHAMLALLAQPDAAGLTLVQADYLRLAVMNAVGLFEAASGTAACLDWAAKLEAEPVYAVNALLVRMLHAQFQADLSSAETQRSAAERLRIEAGGRQMNPGFHLLWEIDAHAIGEDLTRMRHCVDEVARLAASYPCWRAVAHYAQAEQQRIRGDALGALSEIEAALGLVQVGRHQLWANMAKSHVLMLHELGRHELALQRAEQYCEAARVQLGYLPDHLQLVRCLVRARAGHSDAAAISDSLVEAKLRRGETGLELGFAHELRARVASLLDDRPGCEAHAGLCRAQYCKHRHPALTAKFQRLERALHIDQSGADRRPSGTFSPVAEDAPSDVSSLLTKCPDAAQRAQLALSLLARPSGAAAGLLFGLTHDAPRCLAQFGDAVLTPELSSRVQRYLDAQSEGHTTFTGSSQGSDADFDWADAADQRFRPVLLSHCTERGWLVTGVALLAIADKPFIHPAQIANDVSRALARLGEVLTVVSD